MPFEQRAGGHPLRVNREDQTELVAPAQIVVGDVIQDDTAGHCLTVTEVQTMGKTPAGVDGDSGGRRVFSFYGAGPEDRMTVEETERVRRHKR